jgi:hypothetical protein
VKASQNREERLGDSLLDDMRRVQRKAWEPLSRTESEGDNRGSIVALREVHECLQSLGEMLAKAEEKTRQLDPAIHAEIAIVIWGARLLLPALVRYSRVMAFSSSP